MKHLIRMTDLTYSDAERIFALADDFARGAYNSGALLDPCPPFYRGEEVSADVIDTEYFVGCGFKSHLLEVQQAVMEYCLTE